MKDYTVNSIADMVHKVLDPIKPNPQVMKENKSTHVFIETNLRRPHQETWVKICLEIAKKRDDASPQQGFWATMANRMLTAQVFDFGLVDDRKIKEEAVRAGPLIGEGYLNLPYKSVVYIYTLVLDPEDVPPGVTETKVKFATLACLVEPEIWTKQHRPGPMFLAADFIFVDPQEFNSKMKYVMMLAGGVVFQSNIVSGQWSGNVIDRPSKDGIVKQSGETLVSIADGMASLSLMLATKGVSVRKHNPTARQQKARLKKGKEPLPVVTHVDTMKYYRAMENVEKGHHASPVPHLRRGHVRRLHDDRRIWIKDTIVNCRTLSDFKDRDHYEVDLSEDD